MLATDIYVLGQSPSKVIYSYSFPPNKSLERKNLYSDPEMVALRNGLIRVINEEIMQLQGNNENPDGGVDERELCAGEDEDS